MVAKETSRCVNHIETYSVSMNIYMHADAHLQQTYIPTARYCLQISYGLGVVSTPWFSSHNYMLPWLPDLLRSQLPRVTMITSNRVPPLLHLHCPAINIQGRSGQHTYHDLLYITHTHTTKKSYTLYLFQLSAMFIDVLCPLLYCMGSVLAI